jgi:hypothetical protein
MLFTSFVLTHTPHVKYVITQTLQQAGEGDVESLDQNESFVHLRRQAVTIQRGEQVNEITALLPRKHSL